MAKSFVIYLAATPDEITPEFVQLLDKLEADTFEEGNPQDHKHGAFWWLAKTGETIAGFAGLFFYSDIRVGFLCECGVLPKYRGYGLQRRFIRARERYVKKKGYRRIITYTSPDNIPSANNLIKCGYKLYEPSYEWGVDNAFYFEKKW